MTAAMNSHPADVEFRVLRVEEIEDVIWKLDHLESEVDDLLLALRDTDIGREVIARWRNGNHTTYQMLGECRRRLGKVRRSLINILGR